MLAFEGDDNPDYVLLLEGEMAMLRRYGGEWVKTEPEIWTVGAIEASWTKIHDSARITTLLREAITAL